MAILELRNVEAYYGRIRALKGISMEVGEGEIITLIGSNGAGKSTTLKAISGLMKLGPQSQIFFHDREITHLPPHEIARLGIAHVPEGRRILPKTSVMENLQMGAYQSKNKARANELFEQALTLFPRLKERLNQTAGTLSGGEQQMLAMGRALMMDPKLVLLDEPSMGLSPVLVEQIFSMIDEMNKRGITILLVEQNAYLALQIAQRGYVIQTGNIVLTDTGENLQNNTMVQELYLGNSE